MKKKLSILLFSLLSLSCSEKKENNAYGSVKGFLHRSLKNGKKVAISKFRARSITGMLSASSRRKTEMKIKSN